MLNVSCVQMEPKLADFDANLDKMKRFICETMKKYPDTNLIVFPELCTSGYQCTKKEFETLAEEIPGGKSAAGLSALCKQYRVNIVYGLPERDGVLYNSAAFIASNGEILYTYRKVHPFDTEKNWCRAGSEIQAFDTEFGRAGIMICYDTSFPEVARTYALQGAQLLIVPTNWEKPYSDDWDLVTRARAYDNILHLVSANRIGFDTSLGFFGHSRIIDPVGKVIVSLDEEIEDVIHASIDLSLSQKLREEYYTFLNDRRPDTYKALVE